MERCTIYAIKNFVNNKIYIGQTWQTTEKRWNNGHGYKKQPHINNAINLYGKDNFYYEIIMYCYTQEDADDFESYFISKYKSNIREFGYNLSEGGFGGKKSLETKEKISKAKKGVPGRKQSDEIRAKISKKLKGRPVSEETRRKIGEAHRGEKSPNFGKYPSEETRRKISEKNSGKNHPMFNKHHTQNSKKKMQLSCHYRTLEESDVITIKSLLKEKKIKQKEIAKMFNVTPQTICDIKNGRSWGNI